jgi:hypothetical protein
MTPTEQNHPVSSLCRIVTQLRNDALDGNWAIEWQDGPYVDEVALKLLRASCYREGDDYDSTLFGRVTVLKSLGQSYGELLIDGVRVSLRALDPVGWDETYARVWGELRNMMAERRASALSAPEETNQSTNTLA